MGELEEKEATSTEPTTHQQETLEEPKETDKMLEKKDETNDKLPSPSSDKRQVSKPSTPTVGDKQSPAPAAVESAADDKKSSGEEIIDIPLENGNKPENEHDEKKISKEEREVKPKKIPIGGLKLPGFFMKTKPKGEGDGAEGELLEKEPKEETNNEAVAATVKKDEQKPRSNFGERLRNFFARKSPAEKQQVKQLANGDADAKSEATAEAAANEDGEQVEPAVPQKRGLLNAIKLPIANIIPKKKNGDDVELGLGKAGLASMETLDDSLKDQDTVDRAPVKTNGTDDISKLKKSASGEIKPEAAVDEKQAEEQQQQRRPPLLTRLLGYRCSVDDALILLGIVLFLLLLGVIGFVLTHEAMKTPPLREGRYISAVTSCGMVEGVTEKDAFAFRGIPYALPPVGERRWHAAQLIHDIDDCWNGTRQAYNSSVSCTQRLGNGTIIGEEDCLYLDVITPHVGYDNPLPVVVLIGAETLTGPSPGILRPSATFARSQNVIYVRPNFRLGVFGFLALEALTKDAYPRTSGNYALTDIIAVLKWIKLNIEHFGGDPRSVTLLGHRAGATLVSALVTSRQINGLYTRAWASSSSAIFPGKTLQESEKLNQEIMLTLDCFDVACLRRVSSEQLWAATPDTWLHFPADVPTKAESTNANRHEWMVLDGSVLLQHPSEAWKVERPDKPLLVMGTTAHEAHTLKLRERHSNWTAEEVRAYIESSQLGALKLTDEIIGSYNATDYKALAAIISDIRTVCPLLTNARLQPTVPFYLATLDKGSQLLATVGIDVLAILGDYESKTPQQRQFASLMQQLFYTYVSEGTVPSYNPRRRVIVVDQELRAQEDHEPCNYWIRKDIVPRYAHID